MNDFLKDLGHCDYSVRSSERRKGFAAEMLRQLPGMAESISAALKWMENGRLGFTEPERNSKKELLKIVADVKEFLPNAG